MRAAISDGIAAVVSLARRDAAAARIASIARVSPSDPGAPRPPSRSDATRDAVCRSSSCVAATASTSSAGRTAAGTPSSRHVAITISFCSRTSRPMSPPSIAAMNRLPASENSRPKGRTSRKKMSLRASRAGRIPLASRART